jgi:hypothetical protein
MSNKELKEIWYDLNYGNCCGDSCDPTVLYTSEVGLTALIKALQAVESTQIGSRVELVIEEVDELYTAPFTHIEIAEKPAEDEEQEWSWRPFMWFGIIILFILFLAGYGFFELLKSIL